MITFILATIGFSVTLFGILFAAMTVDQLSDRASFALSVSITLLILMCVFVVVELPTLCVIGFFVALAIFTCVYRRDIARNRTPQLYIRSR